MKLKIAVQDKLNKMDKEELVDLINTICDCNDDVVRLINNYFSSSKVDPDKYIDRIDKCFYASTIKKAKAVEIYTTLKKTSADYEAVAKVGLHLLSEVIDYFEECNMTISLLKELEKLARSVAEDIYKVKDNENLRYEYECLPTYNMEFDEVITDCYYEYFSEYLSREDY